MKVAKWLGVIVGGLLAIAVLLGGVLYLVGSGKISATYEVDAAALTIADDSATIARGAHLIATNGCRDCHGDDLSGQVFVDAPPFRVVASNLTSGEGGIGGAYDTEDWDRTIRHGVKPSGRAVVIMPSAGYHRLSDHDIAAMIAYLVQIPPVGKELAPTRIRTVGRIMSAFALDPAMEVSTGRPPNRRGPTPAPTAEYGAYLASITCQYCHGPDLRGMQPPNPSSPVASDLVAAAQRWSEEQFATTLRTGTTPEGRNLNPAFMPWSFTAAMEDYELQALYAHLREGTGSAVNP